MDVVAMKKSNIVYFLLSRNDIDIKILGNV